MFERVVTGLEEGDLILGSFGKTLGGVVMTIANAADDGSDLCCHGVFRHRRNRGEGRNELEARLLGKE